MKNTFLIIFILLLFSKIQAQFSLSCSINITTKTFSFSVVNGSGAQVKLTALTINATSSSPNLTLSNPYGVAAVDIDIPSGGSKSVSSGTYSIVAGNSGTASITLSVTYSEIDGNDSPVSSCTMVGIPLPVTLLNFQAQPQGKTNLINWQTASEKDNEGFQIQRSAEGKTFKNIGFVKGQGTTNEKQSYSFVDEGPLSISYYRLLQKDFDGKESYSKIVSVVSDSKTHVKIYPNPVADVLNVQINTEKELNTALELYDSAGKMVHTENFNTQKGDNQMSFSTKQLARGFYTLKIKQGDEVVVEKVMIQ